MAKTLVLLDIDGPVATVTLNRPEAMNALNSALIRALGQAFDRIEQDGAVRAVIVTGAGKAFSAAVSYTHLRAHETGRNLAEMRTRQGLAYYQELAEDVHALFRRIELSDRPTIAAVNGHALGGGAELLLALDLRILSDRARLGLPEIGMGLFPGAGGTQRLARQIPLCRAKELLFTGDALTAAEAVAIGLANRVVAHDALMAEARALALRLAQQSPLSLRLLKRTMADGADMPLAAALRHEQAMIGLAMESADAREGCNAFVQKRPAVFTGR